MKTLPITLILLICFLVACTSSNSSEEGTTKLIVPKTEQELKALIETGTPQAFLPQIEAFIKSNPSSSFAYYHKGTAQGQQGNLAQALESFNKAIELDPKNSSALGNRGLVYYKSKQNGLALKDFSTAIEIDATNSNNFFNRGLLLGEQEDFSAACKDFKRAMSLGHPNAVDYIEEFCRG